MSKHVHVIGLDDIYLDELRSIRNADEYEFHGVVPYPVIVGPEAYAMDEIMATARRDLEAAPAVDAIIGHWDFPTTSMLPILRREHGLPTPSLASVLMCENKYWARRAMREAAPEATPPFQHVDPFADDPAADIELPYPFWLKPTVAFSSYLGFYVDNDDRLAEALARLRDGIGRFATPFEYFISHVQDRDRLPDYSSGRTCIAEGIISGKLCTLEGYVQDGEVVVYGIVDSLRGPNQVSFLSYEVPSRLPAAVQEQMVRCAERVVANIGLDHTPFNIEMFWNPVENRIWLLEINPRISKSHCAIFRLTAGASHHEVAVDVALGRRPAFPRRDGPFATAGKFMPRVYQDTTVLRVPTQRDLDAVRERFPEALVDVHVSEGQRLGDLRNQDSYSFELADVFVGGETHEELHGKFNEIMELLDFRFADDVETNYQRPSAIRSRALAS